MRIWNDICMYLCICRHTLFWISVRKSWLVTLIIRHKFLLVFGFIRSKWAKEEASIPRHASETPGSLQTLCRSFTSPQLDCLYISDRGSTGQRSAAVKRSISPWKCCLCLCLSWGSNIKGEVSRLQPTPHTCFNYTCVCASETERWKCTHTRTHTWAHIIIKP